MYLFFDAVISEFFLGTPYAYIIVIENWIFCIYLLFILGKNLFWKNFIIIIKGF